MLPVLQLYLKFVLKFWKCLLSFITNYLLNHHTNLTQASYQGTYLIVGKHTFHQTSNPCLTLLAHTYTYYYCFLCNCTYLRTLSTFMQTCILSNIHTNTCTKYKLFIQQYIFYRTSVITLNIDFTYYYIHFITTIRLYLLLN